jgi:hypothetical protein
MTLPMFYAPISRLFLETDQRITTFYQGPAALDRPLLLAGLFVLNLAIVSKSGVTITTF